MNYCNCPNCSTDNCPAAKEFDALCELQSAFEDSVTAQEKAEAENAALRDALSRLIDVHDAMGGVCGSARIAAEEALAKEEGK